MTAGCLCLAACGAGGGKSLDMRALTSQTTAVETTGAAVADATSSGQAGTPGVGATGASGAALSGPKAPGRQTAGATVPGGGGTRAPGITSKLIPADAPGVTQTEIRIGVNLQSPGTGAAITSAFGLKGAEGGDDTPGIKAIINYINAHGGVAGRALVPVFIYTDVTTGTFDGQSEAACSAFTQDNKVFAVAQLVNDATPLLPNCLAKAGVVLLDGGNSAFYDRQTIASDFRATYYSPARLTLDKYASVIDGLARQGYFDPGGKLGIAIYDTPSYRRTLDTVIRPALARVNQPITDVYFFPVPASTAGVSDTAAQAQNAILRFRGKQIDHVMFVDSLGALPFLWMPQAESQGYRPRYGISSGDLPTIIQQNAPAGQLTRAVGVGYERIRDVLTQSFNDTPAIRQCMEALKPAGKTSPSIGYVVACDPFFLLQAALNSASQVSVGGMRAAVDRLGTSFQLGDTPATTWGPDNFDGVAAYRNLAFNGPCSCFQYTSGPNPIR